MEDIDDDFVSSEHDRLISAISKLDKTQHITEPTRNEPSNLSSEFNLIKRSNKLNLSNVAKVLKDTAHHVQIGKKLKKTQDVSKILPKPLEKPQAERIKRATGYEEAKKKIGRWDPIVARSRTVDFVSFPLKNIAGKPKNRQPTKEFLSRFVLKSPLEKELEEIDPPTIEVEEDEQEQTYPMSYDEMVEHRQHLAKIRAQQSYKAAKAKRQSKIKSKKFHRILKKEKLKTQLKEFEELQKKDPEEALKKLEALEKARALERHTLRHKNTGKWAKNKLVRAKYDKEVRQQLAEQLSVSRGLTHKAAANDSTDDEADTNEAIPDITLSQDPMNPWMMKRSDKSNVDSEFDFGYKKYLKEKMFKNQDESDNEDTEQDNNDDNKTANGELDILKENVKKVCEEQILDECNGKETKQDDKKQCSDNSVTNKRKRKLVATSNWIVEPVDGGKSNNNQNKPSEDIITAFNSFENNLAEQIEMKLKKIRGSIEKLEKRSKPMGNTQKHEKEIDNLEYLKLKNQKIKPIIDEELIETDTKTIKHVNESKPLSAILKTDQISAVESIDSNIDPGRFIEVKSKYLNTALPQGDNGLDQLDDDEQIVPRVNIEEVFEEDDVVASFRQEKEDEINKDKPDDIDLSLPGWGSWGGKGVKAPKRKKNRFILKAPPKVPRRDDNKGDIIIKEFKDPKLSAHKVSDVPFPFTSVKEYEASIRAPLGNTFIPEKAHKLLIKPSVITKAGTIIEPMNEEELLAPINRTFKNGAFIKLLDKK